MTSQIVDINTPIVEMEKVGHGKIISLLRIIYVVDDRQVHLATLLGAPEGLPVSPKSTENSCRVNRYIPIILKLMSIFLSNSHLYFFIVSRPINHIYIIHSCSY